MSDIKSNSRSATPISQEWAVLRVATVQDAPAIVQVYHDIYQGTYSYHEYLNPEFIKADITGGNGRWYVIEDVMKGNEICGCISATLDPESGRAYSRGMMVRPDWQGKGGVSRLFGDAAQDFFNYNKENIRMIFCETRTETLKPQSICETIGFKPVGILPFKDVFYWTRETPVLMAVYSNRTWESRLRHVKIVPEIAPIKEYIGKYFPSMKRDIVDIADVDPVPALPSEPVNISIKAQAYGYTTFVATTRDGDASISINFNAQCLNAEHMHFACDTGRECYFLLDALKLALLAGGTRYIEGYCPADDPALQRTFLDVGFRILGYVPAWAKNASGDFVDYVVFGIALDPLNPRSINLTEKAAGLTSVLFGGNL
jgi:RimJ/RimL family protein N-acetyltransferase